MEQAPEQEQELAVALGWALVVELVAALERAGVWAGAMVPVVGQEQAEESVLEPSPCSEYTGEEAR